MTLVLILIAVPVVFWLSTFVYTSYRGSPYVPLPTARLSQITKHIKKGDVVMDLGCGDGRILLSAVTKGATRAEGWELDALVYLMAVWNVMRHNRQPGRIRIHFGDFWNANISDATLIYVYQLEKYMGPFQSKLLPQLKAGTRIVSPDYPIQGMKPLSSRDRVFVYEV